MFHDLRHTFGTLAVRRAPVTDVQHWMGHADIQTTMRYVHYVPQHDNAAKLTSAFGGESVPRTVPRTADIPGNLTQLSEPESLLESQTGLPRPLS